MDILLVVDMQNDFVTGPLGTPEAIAIVDNIKNKVNNRYKYSCIVFTRDTHSKNYLKTLEGKKLPIKHCIKGTPGWCIIDELNSYTEEFNIIDKHSFGKINLFKDTIIPTHLDDKDTIELVGVCTDICVISNALILKAEYPYTNIIVDASCCAGTTPEMHRKALDVMKSCQIDVINDDIEN